MARFSVSVAHQTDDLARLLDAVCSIVLGKSHQIRVAVACLLARGHLLIEDVPGVGKTTLAHALARALGLTCQRIQFTSDLLPADVLGVSVYDRDTGAFVFRQGPLFAHVVLADEVNRATPRAQSALLEAMEERQITVDGTTHPLPAPFFVIATQNPSSQVGTFPLPESQLDRFTMRLALGFPDHRAERDLLRGVDRRELLEALRPCLPVDRLVALQRAVMETFVSDALLDYVQAILTRSRTSGAFGTGLSPRAGQALVRSAQAWALLDGRSHVLPEDIQLVLPHVVDHRLQSFDRTTGGHSTGAAAALIAGVPIP